MVWKLDRLGRSLPHLIETVNALEAGGVGFHSLTETIETTTPGGRLIFGALGQFERDLIRERTRAGLDAAVARGRQGGRRPVVTEEKLRRAKTLITQGLTVREAAVRIKVGKAALYAAICEASESASDVSNQKVPSTFSRTGQSDHFRVVTPRGRAIRECRRWSTS